MFEIKNLKSFLRWDHKMEIIIILIEDNKHSIRIFWAAFQTSLYSRQATNLLTMLVDVWTFGEHWSEVQSSNLQQTIPDVKQYQIRIRQLKLKVVKNNCRFFHFISQFYGRAHNAKAFLKCAPLDSVRGLVRMISKVWFDQASGRTWTRDCAMESENLPLNQTAWQILEFRCSFR